jgi:hypothetical protein
MTRDATTGSCISHFLKQLLCDYWASIFFEMVSQDILRSLVDPLSGGWKVRRALAATFLRQVLAMDALDANLT